MIYTVIINELLSYLTVVLVPFPLKHPHRAPDPSRGFEDSFHCSVAWRAKAIGMDRLAVYADVNPVRCLQP